MTTNEPENRMRIYQHHEFRPLTMPSDSTTSMFEILDETDENVLAIRVGRGSRQGYHELYSMLIEKSDRYETVHVYEETTDWTAATFLTHLHGLLPDLRYGRQFSIDRYAAVGNTRWAKLHFDWWRVIHPIWLIAPEQMRYYDKADRSSAIRWVQEGEQ